MNCKLPTDAEPEIPTVVAFEISNIAVPVGTAAGVQLPEVLQSPDPAATGDHIAFCTAWAVNERLQKPTSKTPATIRTNRAREPHTEKCSKDPAKDLGETEH